MDPRGLIQINDDDDKLQLARLRMACPVSCIFVKTL